MRTTSVRALALLAACSTLTLSTDYDRSADLTRYASDESVNAAVAKMFAGYPPKAQ